MNRLKRVYGMKLGRAALLGALLVTLGGFGTGRTIAQEQPSAVGAVMKLYLSGRLPPERQGAVVEMICNRGNEHDLRVIFDKLVQPDFAPDLRKKTVDWLTDAASTRKVKPTGNLDSLSNLLEGNDVDLQLAAIRLASAWKLNSVTKALQALATNDKSSSKLRRAAIASLVAFGDAASKSTLSELAAASQPMPVRVQAVAGLVGLDLPLACQEAVKLLKQASPDDNTNEMMSAFLDRNGGADALAEALKDQKLSVDVAKMALRYMYSIGRSDATLSSVLSLAAGVASDPKPPTQEEVARLVEEVIAKGDPVRGEKIFRRSELSCTRCHAINRAGGQVGPDLSAVGVSSPVDYLINSILNPNLAVKEQYVTKIFILDGSKVLTGVVVDRDDNRVVLRDSQGKTVTIPTADIEEEVEGKSLMPQGLTKFLNHAEMLDLARFVSELGKPGPFAIRKTASINLWRVLNDPPAELTNDVPHLEHIRALVLNSQPEQWGSAYCMVSGTLPLDELRKPGLATGVFVLQGELQVNETGKVGFHLTCTEKLQVWIDDQPMSSAGDFEANLEPGRHKITLRVELSDREAPQLKLEVIKPSDSKVQFEVVGGA